MGYREEYERWCTSEAFDEKTKAELRALTDEKEIEDRFYTSLEFGTAGLRGIMGAGTNRMNPYTVGLATLGLADYLLQEVPDAARRGVAVAFDTRNRSAEFARRTAEILTAKGIRVYLYDQPAPIPVLSYTVRSLGCAAGVVITASHNPPAYNGYKAYDETGCQLGVEPAKKVLEFVNAIPDESRIPKTGNDALLTLLGEKEIDAFADVVLKQSVFGDAAAKAALKIVYTPIHGSGRVPVTRVLAKDGFSSVSVVRAQEMPDGNFPTVASPNPESRATLEMAIEEGMKTGADLVFGTDPDADRFGCAVREGDSFQMLNGNQVGALLIDFLLKMKKDLGERPVLVKTIVTGELGAVIARSRGCEVVDVLTGFRFIGEKITGFEKERAAGLPGARTFLMGYEESYGYLVGTHARDKDSVVAALLVSEMAACYKKEGKTLLDAMRDLYRTYGYTLDRVDSFTLQGKDGLDRIRAIMADLRSRRDILPGVERVVDYAKGVDSLPPSNVLKFFLGGGSWVVARPSGTEPKLKFYYSLREENESLAAEKLAALQNALYTAEGL